MLSSRGKLLACAANTSGPISAPQHLSASGLVQVILRVGDSGVSAARDFSLNLVATGNRSQGWLASIRRVDAILNAPRLCDLRWKIARSLEYTGLAQCRRSQSPFTTQTTIGCISSFHDGSIRPFLRLATMAGSVRAFHI